MPDKHEDFSVEELTPRRVICTRSISQTPEEDSMKAVESWISSHGLTLDDRRSFGFDVPVSPAELSQGLRGYEYGMEVGEEIQPSEGLSARVYGGGFYAVTRVVNAFDAPFQSIPAGWQKLINWAQNISGWSPVYETCYEETVPGENGVDLILYLAVKKAL